MTQHAEVIKLLQDEIRSLDYMSTPTPNVVTEHFAKENIAKAVKIHAAIDALKAAQAQAADRISDAGKTMEPYGIVYEWDGYGGLHRSFRHYQRNGGYPNRSVTVYTSPPDHTAEIAELKAKYKAREDEAHAMSEQIIKDREAMRLALEALKRLAQRDGWRPFVTEDPSDPWTPAEQDGLDAIAALEKECVK